MPYSRRAKYVHKRVSSPKGCDRRSFRVKKQKRGCVLITVCCPRGKYSSKSKRCKVGMKTQKIMYKKSCYPRKRGD